MKIYRGNVGVEMTLDEFSELISDDDNIDELLNLIYELEMDEAMNYSDEEIKAYEASLMKEMEEYQKKNKEVDDVQLVKRILDNLEKYGQ